MPNARWRKMHTVFGNLPKSIVISIKRIYFLFPHSLSTNQSCELPQPTYLWFWWKLLTLFVPVHDDCWWLQCWNFEKSLTKILPLKKSTSLAMSKSKVVCLMRSMLFGCHVSRMHKNTYRLLSCTGVIRAIKTLSLNGINILLVHHLCVLQEKKQKYPAGETNTKKTKAKKLNIYVFACAMCVRVWAQWEKNRMANTRIHPHHHRHSHSQSTKHFLIYGKMEKSNRDRERKKK